jgi:anti-sigma regulatory factor (Ser/Thr protein kinase)
MNAALPQEGDTENWCNAMRRRYVLTALDDIKNVTSGVIGGLSRFAPLSDERRYNIALVLNELLVNSFEHARPTSASPVFVKAEYSGGTLRIGVTDGGDGFAHAQIGEAEEINGSLGERGRGLKLVRALCSDIRYNDCGNSVEVFIAL